ncbi:MAG: MBL fold metallo-hydrolase [Gammaproteobacteria bacterium]|nr:MBL fold metallo-hydrolase [Gammaproteobacteria bacterium]
MTRTIGALLLAWVLPAVASDRPQPPVGEATAATRAAQDAVRQALPLNDPADYENATRGFVAAIEESRILNPDGSVAWDTEWFAFIDGEAPDTVNPSLWRQSRLNSLHGLFEVVDGIWQVRGYDLAVMSLIRGEKGWIVVDPLTTPAVAAAGLALANEHLGERPVTAVIYTHSHADHFGGVRGIVDEPDVKAGTVAIIGPHGFTDEAVSENLLAGNYMSRRGGLQLGNHLPPGPAGHVGTGLGQRLSVGTIGLLEPTREISPNGETLVIDGVTFEFLDAAGTEAPAEIVFYLPEFKALCTAEVVTRTFHNVLTPRGAKVRDTLRWSQVIDAMLTRYGNDAEVLFASHHWPAWGTEDVARMLRNQRDRYRHVHDQTVRLANHGRTMHEIAEELEQPAFAAEDFSVRDYYGTLNHNSKAVFQHYFGWWDGVPANYHQHPPVAASERYVRFMGGAEAALAQAIESFEEGDYRWAATVFNHIVFADPDFDAGRMWLAASYEQLGFQAESGAWRNYYLTAAYELREGVPGHVEAGLGSLEFLRAVPTTELFNALAVRFDPARFDHDPAEVQFIFPDRDEAMSVDITRAVAFPRRGRSAGPAATVTMDRSLFDLLLLGEAELPPLLEAGRVQVVGNGAAVAAFLAALDEFEYWFDVVTP